MHARSKLRWLLPLHTKEERRALLDSCLTQRLLPAGAAGASASAGALTLSGSAV